MEPLRRSGGFTLVEILVVVLIVGIVMGAALLTAWGGGEHRLAKNEIRRIERVTQVAFDEALFRALEYGLEFRASGYRFLVWDGAVWQPLPEPGVLRDHRWPAALDATLEVEGAEVPLPPEFRVDDPTPQVVFLSSGEVSPFRLTLVADNQVGERLQVHMTAETERAPIDGPNP